jgi:hypothetical protein
VRISSIHKVLVFEKLWYLQKSPISKDFPTSILILQYSKELLKCINKNFNVRHPYQHMWQVANFLIIRRSKLNFPSHFIDFAYAAIKREVHSWKFNFPPHYWFGIQCIKIEDKWLRFPMSICNLSSQVARCVNLKLLYWGLQRFSPENYISLFAKLYHTETCVYQSQSRYTLRQQLKIFTLAKWEWEQHVVR